MLECIAAELGVERNVRAGSMHRATSEVEVPSVATLQ